MRNYVQQPEPKNDRVGSRVDRGVFAAYEICISTTTALLGIRPFMRDFLFLSRANRLHTALPVLPINSLLYWVTIQNP